MPPTGVTLLFTLASLAWAFLLGFTTTPLGPGGVLLSVDLMLVTAVATIGMLLSRSRWSRLLLFGVALVHGSVAGFVDFSPIWLVAVALSTLALFTLWRSRTWFEAAHPHAPLPSAAVTLPLGLLAWPALIGLVVGVEVGHRHWILSAVAVVGAWAYARAVPVALWALRFALLPLGAMAAVGVPALMGLILIVATLGLFTASWTSGAALAVRPTDRVSSRARPVLPELTPPDVPRAAGLDDRRRPLRKP